MLAASLMVFLPYFFRIVKTCGVSRVQNNWEYFVFIIFSLTMRKVETNMKQNYNVIFLKQNAIYQKDKSDD